MKGLIFNVKRYSVHDGPGIRVTFFMKGCPLSCLWCHNPEGISPEPQTVVQTRKVGEKEFNSREMVGRYYSTSEILEILDRERIFMEQSGGGVTFSGGEPMMQHEFLLEALKACREHGYNTAVDTSGYSSAESFMTIMPYTDIFLFDLKHTDDKLHVEYTGVSNDRIIENLRMICDSGKNVIVRIPVIPGKNDDEMTLKSMRDLLSSLNRDKPVGINLLPFHRIGMNKYGKFGMNYRMNDTTPPSPQRMNELKDFFEAGGFKVKVRG
ncbi:MAG TPA: glycyl-radical enzyme activating protein [Bacteroidales bacterium]|nr:glycyl-radical enzyme activating protein [Bacteroidales bacterium]HOG57248.1 glycyl-radical enzyme activating protein [Bacteroidales bacterium]